jgi:hypothetical protein
VPNQNGVVLTAPPTWLRATDFWNSATVGPGADDNTIEGGIQRPLASNRQIDGKPVVKSLRHATKI